MSFWILTFWSRTSTISNSRQNHALTHESHSTQQHCLATQVRPECDVVFRRGLAGRIERRVPIGCRSRGNADVTGDVTEVTLAGQRPRRQNATAWWGYESVAEQKAVEIDHLITKMEQYLHIKQYQEKNNTLTWLFFFLCSQHREYVSTQSTVASTCARQFRNLTCSAQGW